MPKKRNTGTEQTKANDNSFSQFAWRKSVIVSNALMRAVQFSEDGDIADALDKSLPLLESTEISVTGRKDDASQKDGENSVTIAKGHYPYLPVGADAVAITFDIKIVNATDFPQSAKLDTWKRVISEMVKVGDEHMTVHRALTCRSREIFGLVAEQVFSCEWAWRNHDESLKTRLVVMDESGAVVQDAEALGEGMNTAFESRTPAIWRVVGLFKLGCGQSIRAYPSQLFNEGPDSKAARFYKIPGTENFGMRSVKIGNRIKTIDRWYEGYDVMKTPIPVEPMGYFHGLRACLRKGDGVAVRIMQEAIAGGATWPEDVALYMSGITIFGGLLTAEDKESGDAAPQDKLALDGVPLPGDGDAPRESGAPMQADLLAGV